MTNHTREVVTLQLGHYANFVGTHWWNIQESSFVYAHTPDSRPREVKHDVLFREGCTLTGEVTYTPRLVAVDLKGSLNTLRQDGQLYDVQVDDDNLRWHSDVTLHKTESLQKNEFLRDLEKQEELYLHGNTSADPSTTTSSKEQDSEKDESDTTEEVPETASAESQHVFGTKLYDLDKQVRVWSDFLRLHLHPKSIHIVEQYQQNNQMEPFDNFFLGEQVFKDQKSHHEMEDRLHFFLEECDNIQGLHILTDTSDGFGGLASCTLEQLSEDYGNKGLMVFAVNPAVTSSTSIQQDSYRVLNSALAYEKLISHASLFVPLSLAGKLWRVPKQPLSFKHLNYKPDLHYHTSAILAACLDTATMPYRLESDSALMTHMTQALSPLGRKVSCLQASLPFPMSKHSPLVETLQSLGDTLPWQPLTPMCSGDAIPDGQSVVLRGVSNSQLQRRPDSRSVGSLAQCSSIEETVQLYLSEISSGASAVCSLQQALQTTAPFPHIFTPDVSTSGCLEEESRSPITGVDKVPIMTSLQSSSCVGTLLDDLIAQTSRLDIKKFHKFLEAGLEEDDFKETLNNLTSLKQSYESGSGDMA